jgi:outer membrane protein assembly factor BamD (BamD/ComL family)
LGQNYFQSGNYVEAARSYETYLRVNLSGPEQDQALFRLALSHSFPDSPIRDLPQAQTLLQQLINRYPRSPFKPQAEFLLGLQGEVDRLRTDVAKRDDRIRELSRELERLKQIDMQRRPSRPPP